MGDVLVIDGVHVGVMSRSRVVEDRAVAGVVAGDPGVVVGSKAEEEAGLSRVPVVFSRAAVCKVDGSYGPILPGTCWSRRRRPDAMRSDAPLPGTVVGKVLEPLASVTNTIRVLVTLR